jgi:phenylacetate-CoA ligase
MVTRALKQLRFLRKSQYFHPAQLRSYQEGRLRELVRHAYANVTYYRNLFDRAGVGPQDIRSFEDLCNIPITTKKDLQSVPGHEILARGTDLGRCVVKSTSGSTGQPLKIVLSPEERDFQILLNLRILMENGLKLMDKVAYIINPHRFPKSKYWFQSLGILRREYLSVFDYPNQHVQALEEICPDILYGYPSNLTLLALYLREKRIPGIRPRMIFSVAEALEPKARNAINEIMKVNTCDILGTIELGDIAWQCESRDGYHISADAVIVEFLDNGNPVGPGEEGCIVCTSLYGYTMPMIRYAIDDICVPSDKKCTCGRTLPMMASIKGRANDFVLLPDGQIVASCFLVIIMQGFPEVAQYRVVQERSHALTVQVVKGREYNDTTTNRIKDEIERAVQDRLKANIEIVTQIPRDLSGKIRTVISLLPEASPLS